MNRDCQDGGYGTGGYGEGGYGANRTVFSEPTTYYLSLVTSQYQMSPKFMAWLQVCLALLDDASACLYNFYTQFDLSAAIGAQLDTLGSIVGVGRILPFQPSGEMSPILDDSTYRVLLKSQIKRNSWNGTITTLEQLWLSVFPNNAIVVDDNQDMTFIVTLTGVTDSLIVDMINNNMIIPRPEGVQVSYSFV